MTFRPLVVGMLCLTAVTQVISQGDEQKGTIVFEGATFELGPTISKAQEIALEITFKEVTKKDEKCEYYTSKMKWNMENWNTSSLPKTCRINTVGSVVCENLDPSEGFYDPATNEVTLYKLNIRVWDGSRATGHPSGFVVLYVVTFKPGDTRGVASYRLVDVRRLTRNYSEPDVNWKSPEHYVRLMPLQNSYNRPDKTLFECELKQELEIKYRS